MLSGSRDDSSPKWRKQANRAHELVANLINKTIPISFWTNVCLDSGLISNFIFYCGNRTSKLLVINFWTVGLLLPFTILNSYLLLWSPEPWLTHVSSRNPLPCALRRLDVLWSGAASPLTRGIGPPERTELSQSPRCGPPSVPLLLWFSHRWAEPHGNSAHTPALPPTVPLTTLSWSSCAHGIRAVAFHPRV